VTMYVAAAAPHQLIKLTVTGAPVEIVRAK
jgi:hypothetical protein